MNFPPGRVVRGMGIAVLGVTYSILAYYSAATSAATTFPSLGVVVSLAPAFTFLLWLAWRSPARPAMLLLGAVVAGVLWAFWGELERNFSWVCFLQHAGTYAMLAAAFGVTLTGGRKAMCSRFAEAVHGHLAPDLARYTRQITLAWMLFFVAVSLVSGILFFFSSIEIWSIFANFLSFPLIALMFVAEYLVRLCTLPHLEKHSIMDGIRACRKTSTMLPDASSRARQVR